MSHHVELSGTGVVQTAPDIATMRLGVSYPAKTVGDALEGCAELSTKVLAALKALDIAARDIRTTSLSVDPMWGENSEITGHTANQYLNVRLREVTKIGDAISAASAAAGNALRMDSLTWSISNPEPLVAQARDLAYADALDKAQQLAKLSGRKLGRVLRASESSGGGNFGYGGGQMMKVGRGMVADMPAEGGEQELAVSVQVRWELID
ncbi:MAG: SIMPL domain-containing protein [Marmoricola sp.]